MRRTILASIITFLGQVVAVPSRRTRATKPVPIQEVRGITRDDLAELDIMHTSRWALEDLLDDYPGWQDRGMSEADVLGRP
jgi:hypothetical protein